MDNKVARGIALAGAIVLVLCIGMVIGGALVYGVMRLSDGLSAFKAEEESPGRGLVLEVVAPGAVIREVIAGSPAEEAGLQAGDVILRVDGTEIGGRRELSDVIGQYEPGDRITLLIERPGDGELKLRVRLAEHPESRGSAYLGVRYSSAMDIEVPERGWLPFGDEGEYYGWEGPDVVPKRQMVQGAIVIRVVEGSPAAEAGLEAGDVIVSIDDQPVADADALRDIIAAYDPGDSVKVVVERAGEGNELRVRVVLGEHPDEKGTGYLGVVMGSVNIEGFEHLGPGLRFFQIPPGTPLEELPFRLEELPFLDEPPFDLRKFEREFEFEWLPPGDDSGV